MKLSATLIPRPPLSAPAIAAAGLTVALRVLARTILGIGSRLILAIAAVLWPAAACILIATLVRVRRIRSIAVRPRLALALLLAPRILMRLVFLRLARRDAAAGGRF